MNVNGKGDEDPDRTTGPCPSGCINCRSVAGSGSNPRHSGENHHPASGRLPMKTHQKATLTTAGLAGPAEHSRDGKRETRSTTRFPLPVRRRTRRPETGLAGPGFHVQPAFGLCRLIYHNIRGPSTGLRPTRSAVEIRWVESTAGRNHEDRNTICHGRTVR